MPWMIVYDNTNYSRWLPVFYMEMSSLSQEHCQLIKEIFSQSLIGNAYSSFPPERWIECTMNKSSKLKAGWKRLLKNEIGLHIYVRNTNNISTTKHFLENHINAIRSKKKHKDNVKSRLQIDEQCVQDIVTLVGEWKCNPFDPENQNLRTLQTDAYASEELDNNFESAYEDGDALVQDSINNQLIFKSKSLFDPYPKNYRKTFVNLKFLNLNKKRSQEEMETSVLVATIDLFIKRNQELAKTIFEHRITENCLSIINSNGTIRKCQKSKILQEMHLKIVYYSKYIANVDMGLLWRLSAPSSAEIEKGDGTVCTWKDYGDKVFEIILTRHPSASMIIAVNDYYGNDVINVKDGER